MRVLLDECVDEGFRHHFTRHDGWLWGRARLFGSALAKGARPHSAATGSQMVNTVPLPGCEETPIFPLFWRMIP